MLVELPNLWIILLNVVGIPTVHLLIAWWSTHLKAEYFSPHSPFFKCRRWEQGGKIYEQLFRVRDWKDRLPDGAAWFSGFAKSSLQSRQQDYLREFASETCRGEFSHWLQGLAILSFIAWNPFPASLVIVLYAILSNLPCIISQRHTRCRLARVTQSLKKR